MLAFSCITVKTLHTAYTCDADRILSCLDVGSGERSDGGGPWQEATQAQPPPDGVLL